MRGFPELNYPQNSRDTEDAGRGPKSGTGFAHLDLASHPCCPHRRDPCRLVVDSPSQLFPMGPTCPYNSSLPSGILSGVVPDAKFRCRFKPNANVMRAATKIRCDERPANAKNPRPVARARGTEIACDASSVRCWTAEVSSNHVTVLQAGRGRLRCGSQVFV